MIANLHIHSLFSDGTQWPEEIAVRAKRAGYQMIALTDHDSLQGTADFSRACASHGIKGIPGVEIDCVASAFSFDKEILGYFPKGKHDKMTEFTEHLRKSRMQKVKHYLDRAREVVFKAHPRAPELTYAELVKFKLGFSNEEACNLPFSWNKSDFYKFLLSKGVIDKHFGQKAEPGETEYHAFKKQYFTSDLLGNPGHDEKPDLDEIVSIILKDGGFPVLPHYGHLYHNDIDEINKNEDQLVKFLRHCQDIGVWGVEQYYYLNNPSHPAINDYIVKLCKKHSFPFKFTFGSDCHGRGHDNCTLELFSGNFEGFK
ncbi:MAG: PHP domain-containing protein [Candidatus Sigynarchaeota archaeon]